MKENDTLFNLEAAIYGYQMMVDELERLRKDAGDMGYTHTALVVHSKKAIDGISGIVSYFEEARSAILEEEGAVIIPVVDEDKTKLTLLQGGKSDVHPKDR